MEKTSQTLSDRVCGIFYFTGKCRKENIMNTRKSLYDVKSFYKKKAVLKASFEGMRYQVETFQLEGEDACLRVTVWPEPFSFEKTPEEQKTHEDFSFDEEGLDKVYDWLCTTYEDKKDDWLKAKNA
jgi:hypothetical protein